MRRSLKDPDAQKIPDGFKRTVEPARLRKIFSPDAKNGMMIPGENVPPGFSLHMDKSASPTRKKIKGLIRDSLQEQK